MAKTDNNGKLMISKIGIILTILGMVIPTVFAIGIVYNKVDSLQEQWDTTGP